MVSNCTQYGPLLIELIFHAEQMQGRYKDLLNRGYFVCNIKEDNPVYVGMDATVEDQNRQAGKFRHKRQSIAQAVA